MVKMRFVGVVDNQEHRVIVDDHDRDDGNYTIDLDGKIFEVDARAMPSEIISVMINHKIYDVDIDDKEQSSDPLDGRLSVRVKGRVVRLEMLEARRKKMKDAAISHLSKSGSMQISSPMPGKVLRYLVGVGDTVTKDQGLVVIEAMKMENELKSPKDGVVIAVDSASGNTVNGGAPLITIE